MAYTIKDIAKMANVSTATVSRVINENGYVKESTRERIQGFIKEFEFIPNEVARSLSTNESNVIGVVIPDINNPFFCEIIKGVSQIAEKHNLNILLCDTDENWEKEQKLIQMLKSQKIRGIIFAPTSEVDNYSNQLIQQLQNLDIPIVLVDRDLKFSDFDGVFFDNINGSFGITKSLIDAGHSKISIITGPMSTTPSKERLEGYKQALISNKINIDENLIFNGDFKLDSGYALAKKIFELSPRPTSIFVCNNLMTLGVLKYMFENNYVISKDMSIVSFDALDILDTLNIKVSTVDRPTFEMGKISAELLMEKLFNKKNLKQSNVHSTQRITLKPMLVLRGSEKMI